MWAKCSHFDIVGVALVPCDFAGSATTTALNIGADSDKEADFNHHHNDDDYYDERVIGMAAVRFAEVVVAGRAAEERVEGVGSRRHFDCVWWEN